VFSISISDALAVIMRPDAQDYQGTAVTVDVARQLDMPRITIIVNETPPTIDVSTVKARIAETYGCEVIGMLPYSQEIAALASRGIFALRYPQHPVTVALRDIAANLAA
jgi:MinD-like ATPase involved in chromosome partitioning or flagellar assembly